MSPKRKRILIVGSHPNSGYSMINFTQANFDLLNSMQQNRAIFFMKPKSIFSSALPTKYFVYLDKYLIFGPRIFLTTIILRIDLVHVLDHSDSVYRFFVPKWKAFWVTVHDLFAIMAALDQIPQVKIGLSGKIYQKVILNGLRNANLAICISQTTQKALSDLLPSLGSVVLHNFVLETKRDPQMEFRYFSKEYFLIIMNSHWRKNRLASIEVWNELTCYKQFADSHLIIVGNELDDSEIEVIGQLNLPKILVLEKLDSIQIHELYRGCIAVINISKYEGFGMPVIEANLNKKICIFGGSPAFNEIAPSDNIDWFAVDSSIREGTVAILSSESAQHRVHESVLEKFSGNKYRSELINLYETKFYEF